MKQDRSATQSIAGKVFMVKPKLFGFNQQTADTNAFQKNAVAYTDIHHAAISEFMQAVNRLNTKGIEVIVFESEDAEAPDAIFPNNWFSTHEDGTLVLYPMYAPNRRRERCEQAIALIKSSCNSSKCIDISPEENNGIFLEGTGSIIFDHTAKNAYASLSPRTDKQLFETICTSLNYHPYSFSCNDTNGIPFYHTNVILHIGNDYAVIYEEGIKDKKEKKLIMDSLAASKKDIISISFDQVLSFCGNMLQVRNNKGNLYIVCSATALNSFNALQINILERHAEILVFDIPVIEQIGGGGIRCMIAELF